MSSDQWYICRQSTASHAPCGRIAPGDAKLQIGRRDLAMTGVRAQRGGPSSTKSRRLSQYFPGCIRKR